MKTLDDKQLRWLKWIAFDNMKWLEKHIGRSGMLHIQEVVQKREYGDFIAPQLNLIRESFIEDEWILNKWRGKLKWEREYPLTEHQL